MFLGLFTTVILNIVTYIYIDSIMNEKITMIEDDFNNKILLLNNQIFTLNKKLEEKDEEIKNFINIHYMISG
jgi:hypothetical protein